MIRFSVESLPTMGVNEKGQRRATTPGAFVTTTRIDKGLWGQIKQRNACWYVSEDDLEDFGNPMANAGWRYSVLAVLIAIKAGETIAINGVECKTVTELYNEIEAIPVRQAEEERKRQQEREVQEAQGWLGDLVQATGEKPANPAHPEGEVIFDTRNIYGSGQAFVIVSDHEVWLLKANGMDGDDWGRNNLRGQIGWRAEDPEIVARIQQLHQSPEQASEIIAWAKPMMLPPAQREESPSLASTFAAFFGDN